MLMGVLLFAGLAVALGLLGIWMTTQKSRARPKQAPRAAWRLVVPREARFGVAEASTWFTALLPLLPAGETLTFELRGQGG